MNLDLHHRKTWRAFNLTKVAIIALLMIVLVGSGLYEPDWKFDHSVLRKEVTDTVRLIGETHKDGVESHTPEYYELQRARQNWLSLNATPAELHALLDYPNASVKLTAYQALLKRDDQDHFALMLRALNEAPSFNVYIPQSNTSEEGKFYPLGVYIVDQLLVADSLHHINLTYPERQVLLSRRNEIYGHH